MSESEQHSSEPVEPLPDGYDRLVGLLGDERRRVRAYFRLLAAGPDSLPAVRRGLAHTAPAVRRLSCRVLDHLADADSICDLVRLLRDTDAGVRLEALRALACDRCKDNARRPSAEQALPEAVRLLAGDPDSTCEQWRAKS